MHHYKNIKIEAYTYHLPDERIAKYPLSQRDSSQLLSYCEGEISDHTFAALPSLLPPETLMVCNDTKVIRARLAFRKPTGARIEVFLLDPLPPSRYETVFSETSRCTWHCLVGGAKRWKELALSTVLPLADGRTITLTATKAGPATSEGQAITLEWEGGCDFSTLLEAFGELPIPPYLNRDTEPSDLVTYQTLFAEVKGSVAAPTAGLHFTPTVMADLAARGITSATVTLHVGAGTFRPVKSETMEGHTMHSESIHVSLSTLRLLSRHLSSVLAVGTTSTRTLESLYYIGVHLIEGRPDPYTVEQWEPYERTYPYSTLEALEALISHLEEQGEIALTGDTSIIIVPGFTFRIVGRLVTNFHQPHSTLLLLIAAFVGEGWRSIYDHALSHGYRFLSYGDSSLLVRSPAP